MKNFFLTSILLVTIFTSLTAQQAENAAVVKKSDPLKEYMRPSLTTIYINRDEPLSERIIQGAIEKGISGKFNDNSIELNVLSIGGARKFTTEEMRIQLESEVSREIMRCWFPVFNEEIGEFSTHVVAERGMYNATDADMIAAGASNLRDELLKTKGLDLIGRSYILVYDFYNTSKIYNSDVEGYQTDCDVYLYHLDWSEQTRNSFYAQFSNPNGINEVDFPVNHIVSFIGERELTAIKITQSSQGSFLRLTDDKLFAKFIEEIEKRANVYLTKANEDFKVKSTLFEVSPLRAKIGTKEGVKVDQRYFVYEIKENALGEQSTIRKGVMRATSKIAKNDTIATGEGPATTFYQTYGKILYPGMLIQQQPDWGTGYSMLVGTDLQAVVELSVGMWLAKYVPALDNINFPYGTKIYVKYLYPFGNMEIDGGKMDKNYSSGFLGVGVSKDFYFAHYFSATPYFGYQGMLTSEENKQIIEQIGESTSGIEIGLNGGMAILHNAQIVGNIGWSTLKAKWFSTGLTIGVGARYQF